MKTETDLVTSLDHAFDRAQEVIAGVRPEQYGDATPCEEWSVHQLMEHLIGVVDRIGAGVSRSTPARFLLGPDPASQFRTAAAAALAGWRTPGVMDEVIDAVAAGPMPGRVLAGINLLDTATHSWDLATATGQPAELPEDVATAALEVSGQIARPSSAPVASVPSGRHRPMPTPPSASSHSWGVSPER